MLTANIDRYIKYNNKKNTTTLTSLGELQQFGHFLEKKFQIFVEKKIFKNDSLDI